ncbi:Uncharacterized protein NV38_0001437, partial [Leptospira kirschneri serovar Mozdok]
NLESEPSLKYKTLKQNFLDSMLTILKNE